MDDVKSIHVDSKVNGNCYKWHRKKYRDDKIGYVVANRGKKYDYLAMILDYSQKYKLKINRRYYI